MCSAVICFAISVVLGHVLCGVVYGETMGESKDNEEYRKEAKGRNEVNFIPSKVITYLIYLSMSRNLSTHMTAGP